MAAEVGTKLAVNKIKGKLGEEIALDYLKSQGLNVTKGGPAINCGDLGNRFPDIRQWDKANMLRRLYEVKTGGAVRSNKQIAKDDWIDHNRGVGTTVITVGIEVLNQ